MNQKLADTLYSDLEDALELVEKLEGIKHNLPSFRDKCSSEAQFGLAKALLISKRHITQLLNNIEEGKCST